MREKTIYLAGYVSYSVYELVKSDEDQFRDDSRGEVLRFLTISSWQHLFGFVMVS